MREHGARGGLDGDGERIGDRVVDRDELEVERADPLVLALVHREGVRLDAGTSIVALSDSSVISGSSASTSSPGGDMHLDDRDVGEVADVGDADLHQPSQPPRRMSVSTRAKCVVKRAASGAVDDPMVVGERAAA